MTQKPLSPKALEGFLAACRKLLHDADLRAHLDPRHLCGGFSPSCPPAQVGWYVLERDHAFEPVCFDGHFWQAREGILLTHHNAEGVRWYGLGDAATQERQARPVFLRGSFHPSNASQA